VTRHREVDIARRPADQGVADGSTDEMDVVSFGLAEHLVGVDRPAQGDQARELVGAWGGGVRHGGEVARSEPSG
jgi:hypothetical protein